jgi:zinc protease
LKNSLNFGKGSRAAPGGWLRARFAKIGGVAMLAILMQLLPGAKIGAREFPPEVSPPKPMVIPTPAIQTLPNGLQIVVVERHTLPLVTLRLVVKSGAERDPPDLPGTATLVNGLLSEGTERRTSREIAQTVDSIGGVIDNDVDWDDSYLSLSVLTDRTELAFDLVSDMTLHPAFRPEEVERQRQQVLSGLKVSLGDPAYVADTAFQNLIFAGSPYGHAEDGTEASAERLGAADLHAFHRLYYQPQNAILAVVGDITSQEAMALASKYFVGWQNRSEIPPVGPIPPPQAAARRVVAIYKPDAVQTEIRIGALGVPQNSPDYLALDVANEILGGPSENRLFKALRTRQGLTYGASSELITRRPVGAWVAKTFTRTAETVKSAHIALEQVQSIQEHGISRAELETAQSYLVGHLALDFETSDNVAGKVLDLVQNGLPLDYWEKYPENVQALTPDAVNAAARKYLDTENDVVVFVGNIEDFKKDFKKFGETVEIPLENIDFGSPNLVRPARK